MSLLNVSVPEGVKEVVSASVAPEHLPIRPDTNVAITTPLSTHAPVAFHVPTSSPPHGPTPQPVPPMMLLPLLPPQPSDASGRAKVRHKMAQIVLIARRSRKSDTRATLNA